MNNIFKFKNTESRVLVNKFLNWGLFFIIIIGLDFCGKRNLIFSISMPQNLLQILVNIRGFIYNASTILIPLVGLVLFKLFCEIIYLFLTSIKDK